MTGFAGGSGGVGALRWTWELRSVNGKGLDIRLKLPPGHEYLDPAVRKVANAALSRGNIQISLSVERDQQVSLLAVNDSALATIMDVIEKIDNVAETAPSTAAQVLALRGVMETVEPLASDEEQAVVNQALLEDFDSVLTGLVEHRAAEGAALSSILLGHVNAITELIARAEADPSHTPDAIRDKLMGQIDQLAAGDVGLDPARLHQEASLLATKADVREELDRLKAHCDAAGDLIAVGSPVGRKLEFLSQEFNREANTLCSKSNAVSLTAIGLELKTVIDQFREQILNVE